MFGKRYSLIDDSGIEPKSATCVLLCNLTCDRFADVFCDTKTPRNEEYTTYRWSSFLDGGEIN